VTDSWHRGLSIAGAGTYNGHVVLPAKSISKGWVRQSAVTLHRVTVLRWEDPSKIKAYLLGGLNRFSPIFFDFACHYARSQGRSTP